MEQQQQQQQTFEELLSAARLRPSDTWVRSLTLALNQTFYAPQTFIHSFCCILLLHFCQTFCHSENPFTRSYKTDPVSSWVRSVH